VILDSGIDGFSYAARVGGSIHVTLTRQSAVQPSRASIRRLLQRESWNRTTEDIQITKLVIKIEKIGQLTRETLLKFGCKPIFGIGAPISTTHLISQFKIGDFIQTLFDEDLNNVGKFPPSAGIEVKKFSELPND
jgi:hypothetical protein